MTTEPRQCWSKWQQWQCADEQGFFWFKTMHKLPWNRTFPTNGLNIRSNSDLYTVALRNRFLRFSWFQPFESRACYGLLTVVRRPLRSFVQVLQFWFLSAVVLKIASFITARWLCCRHGHPFNLPTDAYTPGLICSLSCNFFCLHALTALLNPRWIE